MSHAPATGITRRQFSASALGVIAAPAFLRGRNLNERLRIAAIGVGGRGGNNLHEVGAEDVVALCDVAESAVEAAASSHPKARKYRDFRRLYDHAADFDAVVVSICEHTHAFATLPGLQLGKHVYCEKPLTYNGLGGPPDPRGQPRRTKVATQMGTQIHAGRQLQARRGASSAPERSGRWHEVHVWVDRAWGRQSKEAAQGNIGDILARCNERPSSTSPVPARGSTGTCGLGPAPERSFNEVYYPGPKWYRWWDYGNGTMSDLGSHWNDLPFWALKLHVATNASRHSVHHPIPKSPRRRCSVTYEYGRTSRHAAGEVARGIRAKDKPANCGKEGAHPQVE